LEPRRKGVTVWMSAKRKKRRPSRGEKLATLFVKVSGKPNKWGDRSRKNQNDLEGGGEKKEKKKNGPCARTMKKKVEKREKKIGKGGGGGPQNANHPGAS